MKKNLLNLICCPDCHKDFNLEIFKKDDEEISEGSLSCICRKVFLITDGIPRILPRDLSKKKKETAESFAFEWQKFSQMREEWKKNFDFYFEPVQPILDSGIALEAGCGNGRHSHYASKIFKELVSVDLGQAVDVAYKNNKDKKNIHFIQADILNLPFRENTFDFVFSIGVLHHLPDPEKGFKKLVNFLKPSGGMLLYVYHSFKKSDPKFYLLGFVNFFRRFTTKLPHRILYLLCFPIAAASYLILVLPYKYFFKNFIKQGWPLGAYKDYTFYVMLNDTFDRFSAPIENRYSKEEILKWYEKENFKNIKILPGSGLRLFGNKT